MQKIEGSGQVSLFIYLPEKMCAAIKKFNYFKSVVEALNFEGYKKGC